MLGTYGSFLLILAASSLVGQAIFALCGRRRPSWLSPAVGLAALLALAWGTIRLPGDDTAALVAVLFATAASLLILRGRVQGPGRAVIAGLPATTLGVLAASIPFFVEGRFGILGTGLDPDMSQHLLAAHQLAAGEGGPLLAAGYPLGPHALVAAVSQATGASLVQAFDGLALAVAVAAVLAPLAILGELAPFRRLAGALLVGLPYMFAAYLIQGAFKETIEALFVLVFAIGMHELHRGRLIGGPRATVLVGVPLAVLAIGAAYSYSFPGLIWIAGGLGLWATVELLAAARRYGLSGVAEAIGISWPPLVVALVLVAAALAPELGRLADFASFQTFDPHGAGLGNLFNRISPLEALGIWPSGDFRLDPGAGVVPAIGFYLGCLLGAVALLYGLAWWLRRGELAVPAVLAAAALLVVYALAFGTPYQEAKAIAIASPLAMLVSARALLSGEPLVEVRGLRGAFARRRGGAPRLAARLGPSGHAALALAFVAAAAGSSALALANGPVGPSTWSPALQKLRHELGSGSTLALAPADLLGDEHGRDFLVWELRGGRVCVDSMETADPTKPPPRGIAHVVVSNDEGRPFAGLRKVRTLDGYSLWDTERAPASHGSCPVISPSGRANPAKTRAGRG